MQLFKNITQIFFLFSFIFFIKFLMDYLLLELIFSDQVKATLTEVCVCGSRGSGGVVCATK